MKRGKIILMAVVILSLVSRKGYGQENPEEILLTAPLFFENRIPEQLTAIQKKRPGFAGGKRTEIHSLTRGLCERPGNCDAEGYS